MGFWRHQPLAIRHHCWICAHCARETAALMRSHPAHQTGKMVDKQRTANEFMTREGARYEALRKTVLQAKLNTPKYKVTEGERDCDMQQAAPMCKGAPLQPAKGEAGQWGITQSLATRSRATRCNRPKNVPKMVAKEKRRPHNHLWGWSPPTGTRVPLPLTKGKASWWGITQNPATRSHATRCTFKARRKPITCRS